MPRPPQMAIGWFVIAHRAFGFARSDRNIEVLKRWEE